MHFSGIFSKLRTLRAVTGIASVAALGAMCTAPAHAQELFSDEFNSSTFNDNNDWIVYDNSLSLQRTQFGLSPFSRTSGGVSYARVPLQSYNPNSSSRFLGTEFHSKQRFSVGTGIEFETRVRGLNLPRGIVFAFFTYSEKGQRPNDYLKEEIDFEMLSNLATNRTWTNIWSDGGPRYGNDGFHQKDAIVSAANYDYTGWTTYKVRWYPDRVEWYVNDVLARTERTVVPDDPMAVHFNIWAADSGWGTAYDSNLRPTSSASNTQYFMDVDYLRVRKLPAPSTGVWGNGDGLKAAFYPSTDFTGNPVRRVDPRVNHDWGQYTPDPAIPVDKFSGRWTGSISSPYSEDVTFFLRGDDGVRLFINNQLVLEDWIDTNPKERSVTIPMQAGVKVPITIEYYDNTGGALCQFSWQSASMAKTVVPQCQLFTAGDFTPPTVSLTAPTSTYSYRTLTVSGTATDSGDGVEKVTIRVRRRSDNQFWNGTEFTSNATDLSTTLNGNNWSRALTSLPDGEYIVMATATDKGSNSASTSERSFWIDNLAPVITLVAPFQGASYLSVTSMNGRAVDAGGGLASVAVTLQRASDNSYWSTTGWVQAATENNATLNGNLWKLYTANLPVGTYTVSAKATDYVGNVSAWSRATFTMQDGKPPVTTLTAPFNGASYPSATSMNGTARDAETAVGSVLLTLRRSSDGAYWNGSRFAAPYVEHRATLSGQNWKFFTGSLATGTYVVSARSFDYSGNESPTANATFTVTGNSPAAISGKTGASSATAPSVNSF